MSTPTTVEVEVEGLIRDAGNDWRSKVYFPERFSEESQKFLDQHYNKGKLSKTGIFKITDNIGATVPYELLEPRIKRIIQKINDDGDLLRSAFETSRKYRNALVILHVHGYLHELKDKSLLQKRKAKQQYLKKWAADNPEKIKQYARNARKYRKKWRSENEMWKTLSNSSSSL